MRPAQLASREPEPSPTCVVSISGTQHRMHSVHRGYEEQERLLADTAPVITHSIYCIEQRRAEWGNAAPPRVSLPTTVFGQACSACGVWYIFRMARRHQEPQHVRLACSCCAEVMRLGLNGHRWTILDGPILARRGSTANIRILLLSRDALHRSSTHIAWLCVHRGSASLLALLRPREHTNAGERLPAQPAAGRDDDEAPSQCNTCAYVLRARMCPWRFGIARVCSVGAREGARQHRSRS